MQNTIDNTNEIRDFIENELKIDTVKHLIGDKEIDVFIPSHNIGIEFDGLYWHSILFKEKKYHVNKTELCEANGIQLLHIFEDEWVNKKDIVKSIIRSKLGVYENKIFARKCKIKEITPKMVGDFLKKYHMQGNVGAAVRLGLFYNDELVSLMTFGKKRVSMGTKVRIDGEYEMMRFCNKLNSTVIGGASRLLSHFVKNYQPKEITTFADRRYSDGGLYKQLGFVHVGNTDPSYFYFKQHQIIREYRFKYRKDILVSAGFDANLTEHQIMTERGYYRIYDCGHMKFTLKINEEII